jgi:hypothetical protein
MKHRKKDQLKDSYTSRRPHGSLRKSLAEITVKTGFVEMIIFWSPKEIIIIMIFLPFSEASRFWKLLSSVVQMKDLVNIIIKVKNLTVVL